jgi:hypothetical protein
VERGKVVVLSLSGTPVAPAQAVNAWSMIAPGYLTRKYSFLPFPHATDDNFLRNHPLKQDANPAFSQMEKSYSCYVNKRFQALCGIDVA